ncbi:MAG: AAA family ATPase [bacterium]|nr:AAA family ATPase [bacterium]
MPPPLSKLSIHGFKSIRAMDELEFSNLNVLIGANGSGKSNLISFFRMLRHLVDGALDEYIREAGGVGDLLFNGRKGTEHMSFRARFGIRGYSFHITPGPLESAFLTDEERFYEHGQTGWWNLPASGSCLSSLVKEAKSSSDQSKYSKPVYDTIASWQIYHFHDTGPTASMRHAEIVQDNKVLRSDAANIAPYLLRLRSEGDPAYQEIINAVRLVTPFFDHFGLEELSLGQAQKVSLSWHQKASDFPMQSYHLSDGSLRFICLATALLQPELPSCLILDEPELGLHPAAIHLLAELIHDAAKRTQLIIATQSPELINQFEIKDIIVVNHEGGASTFSRLDEQDYSTWLEDYSIGELWSKNVIRGGPNFG